MVMSFLGIISPTPFSIWHLSLILPSPISLNAFLGTAEALAQQVTAENYEKGLIYPPFSNIRKISAHIAANVAAKAYELGLFFFLFFSFFH